MDDLTYELRKCKECSCSRCSLNGTPGCYIDIAIKELNRYEQAMDSLKVAAITDGVLTLADMGIMSSEKCKGE